MGTPLENPNPALVGNQEIETATAGTTRDVADVPAAKESNLGFRSRFLMVQNAIGIVLSVPVLVTGIYVTRKNWMGGEQCASFMVKPIVAMGALLLLVSLGGLVAAIVDKLSRSLVLAWLHLLIMFFLTILLFCFAIFSLEITNTDLAHTVHGYGQNYTEYRLYEYPKWMRRRVENPTYWSNVKFCLRKSASSVCHAGFLLDFGSNFTHTNLNKLTPLQRGCCMPPSACNITYLTTMANQVEETTRNTRKKDLITSTSMMTLQRNQNQVYQQEEPRTNAIAHQQHSSKANYKLSQISRKTLVTSPTHARNHKTLKKTIHAYTHDCKNWEFTSNKLCYDCDTCRAAVIQTSMDKWKQAGTLYVILVMVLIVTYAFFSCYGFEKLKRESSYRVPTS